MTIDNYGPLIGDPSSGANISVAAYGDPVRLAIIDLDARLQGINQGLSNTVRKANTDTVTNSVTMHNDSELVLPVLANTNYKLEGFIILLAPTGNDMTIGWTLTGASPGTALWTPNALPQLGTGAADITNHAQYTNTGTPIIGGITGTNLAAKPIGIVFGGNSDGTIIFRFAQGTAGVGTTAQTLPGSWISLTQI